MITKSIGAAMGQQVDRVNEKADNIIPLPQDASERVGTQELPINLIRMDGGTQSRAQINSEVVNDYKEAMEDGMMFPAVIVFYDGNDYWLADGFHRVHAANRLGYKKIYANVLQGTQRDAILCSVGANEDHGLRRTKEDKERAVVRLLTDDEWKEWSYREIARRCRVSHPFVSEMARKHNLTGNVPSEKTYTTKHGTTAKMNTGNIGKKSEPTPETKTTVDVLLSTTYQETHNRLATALEAADDDIRLWCIQKAIVEAEKVEYLNAGRKDGREWVNELITTDYIQPGEEHQAVHYTASILEWKKAIENRQAAHVQIAMDNREQSRRENALKVMNTSENNEWYTPESYLIAARLLMGGIDLDPASCEIANRVVCATTYYTIENDGLKQAWNGKVWLNPPYGYSEEYSDSNQAVWTARLISEYHAGNVSEAVLLVNAVTDRVWFQPLWDFPICFTDHRVRFRKPTGEPGQPTMGSALVYFGANTSRFTELFSEFGPVVTQLVRKAK